MTQRGSEPRIRPLLPTDTDSILRIIALAPEAASWSRSSHEQFMVQDGVIGFVSEADSRVTGFIVARQVAEDVEVLNLAVAPDFRHSGHGSALLVAVLDQFQRQGASRVFLEVRASNTPAIAFYQRHGFGQTGRRKAYYRDPDEDALIMGKKLKG